MGALWNEIKNWRRSEHWNTKKFFQALVLGLLLTFLDTLTDLVFARSLPDECPDSEIIRNISSECPEKFYWVVNWQGIDYQRMDIRSQNHCSHVINQRVKFCTYTFIAWNHAQLLRLAQSRQRIVEPKL